MNKPRCLDAGGYEIFTGDFINQTEEYTRVGSDEHSLQVATIVTESSIAVKITLRKSNISYRVALDPQNVHIIGLSAREYLERIPNSVKKAKDYTMRTPKKF